MGWTRSTGRTKCGRRRLTIESLENRDLLTHIPHAASLVQRLNAPVPATDTMPPATLPSGATDFDQIIGASVARATYGVDGTGMAVAVIDTGINYNNADFSGGGFGPGHKVIAGFDFSTNTPDPLAVTWQHGTAVAGLAAGNSPTDPGIAPGANVVALRVFGNDNASSFTRIVSALQWVVDNHSKYNITVVNLSLSDGGNYTQNWFTNGVGGQIVSLIQTLDNMKIPVVTAAGNNFTGTQGEGFSAIVSNTISVTATTNTDQLVSNAQRLGRAVGGDSATVIAAPGQGLRAPAEGNTFTTVDGTSFATPIVSGSILLLQQIYQSRFGQLPTVAQLEGWLQEGAVQIHDSVTGIDIGRLSIQGAAAFIPSPPPPPPVVSTPPAPVVPPPPPIVTSPPPIVVISPPPIAETSPPPPTSPSQTVTNYFDNGKAAGSFKPDKAMSGWASFFSLFTGRLTTLSVWGKASHPVPAGSLSSKAKPKVAVHPLKTSTNASMKRAWSTGFVGQRRPR